jgi:hypothetical protein
MFQIEGLNSPEKQKKALQRCAETVYDLGQFISIKNAPHKSFKKNRGYGGRPCQEIDELNRAFSCSSVRS